MDIENIERLAGKPELYAPGTATMWDDPYISKQLLGIHLDPEADLASRKAATNARTLDWIMGRIGKGSCEILDLGCGPGLYSAPLAEKGHRVRGIDISPASIAYAREQAKAKSLSIEYIQGDYLKADLGDKRFDLAILIYTDFGILLPTQRDTLLEKVHRALKPNGVFIFDVLNDKDLKSKVAPRNWDVQKSGFWRAEPYLVLSNSYLYEKEKVILYQHIVTGGNGSVSIYRFWTHAYSHDDLSGLLGKHGFREPDYYEDVLPAGDIWNGDNVTFCRTVT